MSEAFVQEIQKWGDFKELWIVFIFSDTSEVKLPISEETSRLEAQFMYGEPILRSHLPRK